MKFFSVIIVTALLSLAAGFVFPWWAIAPVAFVIALVVPQKPGFAFLSAFLALAFLWGGLASYIDVKNKHILAGKLADLFFGKPSHYLLVVLTSLIGGLVAGFSALTASLLRAKKINA
jgi:hypothetical protein